MIVLVCGGRDYQDRDTLEHTLTRLAEIRGPFTQVIHGGARGADRLAGEWGTRHRIPVRQFPAQWDKNGPAAGPIRNQQMLEDGKPDLVVAFAGGRGTADIVRRARAAGVEVVEVAAAVITISQMVEGDLDSVMAIERASFPTPWSRQAFLDALARNPAARCSTARCLVARVGGRRAGYLLLEEIKAAPAIHVVHLAVRPALRRLGVAKALLGAVLDDARTRGVGRVYLRVRTLNAAAIGLYRDLGFEVVGRRPGFYSDGEDALEMALEPARAVVPTSSTEGAA